MNLRSNREWGDLLLFAGFLCLFAVALTIGPLTTTRWSQAVGSIPDQQSFTRREVYLQITHFYERLDRGQPWLILVPAIMMLAGGLLLKRATKEGNGQ